MIYKIRTSGKPVYFYEKIAQGFPRNTRLAANSKIRENVTVKTALAESNFSYQAPKLWNKLPTNIRTLTNLKQLKVELKTWVKDNIDL